MSTALNKVLLIETAITAGTTRLRKLNIAFPLLCDSCSAIHQRANGAAQQIVQLRRSEHMLQGMQRR